MKKIILMTMLMSAVFAQGECNKDNWQEYYNSEGRDMTDCDLSRADLRGADLTGAFLRGADLTDARLTGAFLTGADFRGAVLRRADLTDANLEGADLSWVNLQDGSIARANLTGANLTESHLEYTALRFVRSSNLIGTPFSLPEGWSIVDGELIFDEGESSTTPAEENTIELDDNLSFNNIRTEINRVFDDRRNYSLFKKIDITEDGQIEWRELVRIIGADGIKSINIDQFDNFILQFINGLIID